MDNSSKFNVLVVDDTEENIEVLVDLLEELYDISVATDGKEALDVVSEDTPDLILLDIMMPEMDGYEVCRRLKAEEATRDIPIIFLTAMTAEADEKKGLDLGAIDYITKPFSPELVLARVRNQLKLVEAARLREDIERISRHDLKTPLNTIINLPKLMNTSNLTDEQKEQLKKISATGYKMLNMINMSLDMFKMEQGTYQFSPVQVDVIPVVAEIAEENDLQLMLRGLTLDLMLEDRNVTDGDQFLVNGEKLLLYSMFANTVKNAIEASPEGEPIVITLKHEDTAIISIHNQGAVPEEIRDRFFEKYATAGKSGGTGLGTYSARLIAEIHGGTVELESSEEKGTTIIFSLPE